MTLQENVILQTAASTGQSIIFAGGFTTYFLAMDEHVRDANPSLGTDTFVVTYWQAVLWLVITIWLGFFLAIPLRKEMVVKQDLPWPSARATAVVLEALHAQGGDILAWKMLKYLTEVTFVSFAWFWFKWLYGPAMLQWPIFGAVAAKYYWTQSWSTAYIGAGVLMNASAVYSLVFGAVLMFGIYLPLADNFDCFQESGCGEEFAGTKSFWFLPSLAITVVDAVYQLISLVVKVCRKKMAADSDVVIDAAANNYNVEVGNSNGMEEANASTARGLVPVHSVTTTNTNGEALTTSPELGSTTPPSSQQMISLNTTTSVSTSEVCETPWEEPPERLVPDLVWKVGFSLNAIAVVILVPILYNVPWYLCLACVCLGPLFAYGINLGSALTDTALISAIGKFILIVFSPFAGNITSALWLAGVGMVTVGSSNDLLSDYVVAHQTKTSPRNMFYAQLFAACTSLLMMPILYTTFLEAFPISASGNGQFTAPGAVALRALAFLFSEGLSTVPPAALVLSVVTSVAVLINNILKDTLPKRYSKWLPASIAVAIGGYVAPSYAINPLIGFIIASVWLKKSRTNATTYLPALGAGLIAGEGLAAIVSAIVILAGGIAPVGMAIHFAYAEI